MTRTINMIHHGIITHVYLETWVHHIVYHGTPDSNGLRFVNDF